MNISVRNFADMARQATQRHGYIDTQTVVVQNERGVDVQETQLVIRGTGWLSRMKRALGMRDSGAADRVHTAYVAALQSELGLENWNKLPEADRARLSGGQNIPSARRRILSSADLAQQLIRAKDSTSALVDANLLANFPGRRLEQMIQKAHNELLLERPNLRQPLLKVEDLQSLPYRSIDAGAPNKLLLIEKVRTRVNAALMQDPKNPVPQHVIDGIMVAELKSAMLKAQELHEILDTVGVPMLQSPDQTEMLRSAARRLIAGRELLSPPLEAEHFRRALLAAPDCARLLSAIAAAAPGNKESAVESLFRHFAHAQSRVLDEGQGQMNSAYKAHIQSTLHLGIEIARLQGTDLASLRAALRESPAVNSLFKGCANFLDLNATQGDFLSKLASGVGEAVSALLDEMDRQPNGHIPEGMGAEPLRLGQDELLADGSGRMASELDHAVDGPIFERVMGFHTGHSPEHRAQANERAVAALLDDAPFTQALGGQLGLNLADLQPGLRSVLQSEAQARCTVLDRDGTARVVRLLQPQEAQQLVEAAAQRYADHKKALLEAAGHRALDGAVRSDILSSPAMGEPADGMALQALRQSSVTWAQARALAQAGEALVKMLDTMADGGPVDALVAGLANARRTLAAVSTDVQGQLDQGTRSMHLSQAMQLASAHLPPDALRKAYAGLSASPITALLAGLNLAGDPDDSEAVLRRVKVPAASAADDLSVLARALGQAVGERQDLVLMRMEAALPTLEIPQSVGMAGLARLLGTAENEIDTLASDLSNLTLPDSLSTARQPALHGRYTSLMGIDGSQAPFVPPGSASVTFVSPEELRARNPDDGQDYALPLAAYHALGADRRQAINDELNHEMQVAAQAGPFVNLAEQRFGDFLRDMARAAHVFKPDQGEPINPRRQAQAERDAEAAAPRLTQAFTDALNALGLDGARQANALRDLATIANQGLLSYTLNDLLLAAKITAKSESDGMRLLITPDPDSPGSLLMTDRHQGAALSISSENQTFALPRALQEGAGAEQPPLPAIASRELRFRYTPSDVAGAAGTIECLNGQIGYAFTSVPDLLEAS